ncbi:uncharacterized protein LOC135611617 [Musa acuminata AAA Group]|uniref:uncharacterized protein LOC135611617 n=1 Tax=Musa acuminata AAA Group TaxID=214697 RepID=UPI0031D6E42D
MQKLIRRPALSRKTGGGRYPNSEALRVDWRLRRIPPHAAPPPLRRTSCLGGALPVVEIIRDLLRLTCGKTHSVHLNGRKNMWVKKWCTRFARMPSLSINSKSLAIKHQRDMAFLGEIRSYGSSFGKSERHGLQ